MTYSPSALTALYPIVDRVLPSMEKSGVAADKAGYHNSRNRLKSVTKWKNDYSILTALDKLGDGDAASAIDMKFNTAQLKLVCQRMMKASLAKDPRVQGYVREWFGSYDGKVVIGYSLYRVRPATSDSSHLWHFHASIFRKFADDKKRALGLAEVLLGLAPGKLTGTPVTTPASPTPAVYTPDSTVIYLDRLTKGRENSDSVWWIQTALNKVLDGADLQLTADYDTATLAAAMRFQHLVDDDVIDGLLGPLDVAALLGRAKMSNMVEDEA